MIFAFYAWSGLLQQRRWQLFAAIMMAAGLIFNVTLALHRLPRESLYVERVRAQAAIEMRDYRIMGERRPGSE